MRASIVWTLHNTLRLNVELRWNSTHLTAWWFQNGSKKSIGEDRKGSDFSGVALGSTVDFWRVVLARFLSVPWHWWLRWDADRAWGLLRRSAFFGCGLLVFGMESRLMLVNPIVNSRFWWFSYQPVGKKWYWLFGFTLNSPAVCFRVFEISHELCSLENIHPPQCRGACGHIFWTLFCVPDGHSCSRLRFGSWLADDVAISMKGVDFVGVLLREPKVKANNCGRAGSWSITKHH